MAHQTVGRGPSVGGGQFQELRSNNHVYSYCHFNVIIEIVIKERGKRDDSERKRENKLDSERLSLLKYYGQTRLIHFSLEARFSPKLLAFTFI